MKKLLMAFACLIWSAIAFAQPTDDSASNVSFVFIGIGIVALGIAGYLVYRFFKNTEEKKADLVPVITRIYPNPSQGPITIEIHGHASTLKILNMSGHQLGSF